jgi:hypothetical protein
MQWPATRRQWTANFQILCRVCIVCRQHNRLPTATRTMADMQQAGMCTASRHIVDVCSTWPLHLHGRPCHDAGHAPAWHVHSQQTSSLCTYAPHGRSVSMAGMQQAGVCTASRQAVFVRSTWPLCLYGSHATGWRVRSQQTSSLCT